MNNYNNRTDRQVIFFNRICRRAIRAKMPWTSIKTSQIKFKKFWTFKYLLPQKVTHVSADARLPEILFFLAFGYAKYGRQQIRQTVMRWITLDVHGENINRGRNNINYKAGTRRWVRWQSGLWAVRCEWHIMQSDAGESKPGKRVHE